MTHNYKRHLTLMILTIIVSEILAQYHELSRLISLCLYRTYSINKKILKSINSSLFLL